MGVPRFRRYTHPGFINTNFTLLIPDSLYAEAEKKDPLDVDKAILDQFSLTEKAKLKERFP